MRRSPLEIFGDSVILGSKSPSCQKFRVGTLSSEFWGFPKFLKFWTKIRGEGQRTTKVKEGLSNKNQHSNILGAMLLKNNNSCFCCQKVLILSKPEENRRHKRKLTYETRGRQHLLLICCHRSPPTNMLPICNIK